MDTINTLKKVFEPTKGNPRLMKFPYTMGAQVAMFPYKFYFQNNWIFRYILFGVGVTGLLFHKINGLVNTPENKAKWKEIRRKELLETHYLDHEH